MEVSTSERNLVRLGRYWAGEAFKSNDDLQCFADEQGIVNFIARLAIAEHDFLGDVDIDMEVESEEISKRIDDMLAAARAVCKIKR